MPLKTLFLFSKQVAADVAPQISRTPDKTNDHRKFSVSGMSKGKFRSLSKTRKLPRIEKPALKIHKTEAALRSFAEGTENFHVVEVVFFELYDKLSEIRHIIAEAPISIMYIIEKRELVSASL